MCFMIGNVKSFMETTECTEFYLRATKKRVGLLINFNVERLKDGLRRLIV